MKICSVQGCGRKVKARGVCNKHHLQLLRYGKVLERTRANQNEILLKEEGHAEIILYSITNTPIAKVLIDVEDIDKVKEIKWARSLCKNGSYCTGTLSKSHGYKKVLIHRMIMDVHNEDPKKIQIDHINGDGLDCRKANLRKATNQQNSFNKNHQHKNRKSKYKGLSYNKITGKWVSKIQVSGVTFRLGTFVSEEAAAIAYDRAALKHHGEFACLNILNRKRCSDY